MSNEDWTIMDGTEGTKEYVVYGRSPRGRLGVREYAAGRFRIRVEPGSCGTPLMAPLLTREAGWKQPGDGGQPRFSTVVSDESALKEAVKLAMTALNFETYVQWANAPEWAMEMVKANPATDRPKLSAALSKLGLELPEGGAMMSFTRPKLVSIAQELGVKHKVKATKIELVELIRIATEQ